MHIRHRSTGRTEPCDRLIPKYGVLRVVLIYAVCAVTWIVVSDKVVAWLFADRAQWVLAGTVKGWLFVAITSLLLHGLIRQLLAGRERTEIALRRERDRNQRYLDTVQTLMVALDRTGKITMINRRGCEVLGYDEAELLGRHWFQECLPQPEGMGELFPMFQRLMADGLDGLEYCEAPVLCRDGRQAVIAWRHAYLVDEANASIGILSSGEDITDRKQAEKALRESEDIFRVMADAAQDAIVMLDQDGKISFWNRAAETIFGYDRREALGQDAHRILVPEDHHALSRVGIAKFQASGQGTTIGRTQELSALRKDGALITVELSLSAVRRAGA